MVAQDDGAQSENLADLQAEVARKLLERDRNLALDHARSGKSINSMVEELMTRYDVKRRTVYRAVARQGAWAKAELERIEAEKKKAS